MNILDKINKPSDIKDLSIKELEELASELRTFLLENVSKTGGHLASNLGIVELTLALFKNYDFAKDKIVFDVGHQSYVYKILTGRKDNFDTLRTKDGISGFPKREESTYDYFDTGHSSNSVSAALGIARARDLKKEDYEVVSIIGDGAFTGGMVYEALNDLGYKNSKMLIILNDNGMSISSNVGGLTNTLNKFRLTKSYNNLKRKAHLNKNNPMIKIGRKVKNSIKNLFFKPMFFESLGVRYIGPVDGHNIKELNDVIKKIKKLNEPVVLHIVTTKGQGYLPAMEHPEKFHAVGKFDLVTGDSLGSKNKTYSKVFGEALLDLAKKDERIVAITAAMIDGTGLNEFAKIYPNRLFDVGITEGHAVTLAAGMATSGLKPIFAVYSTFLQRGFDQIIIDVCMQNLPVIFAIDRAGLVGNDGKTHQGVFDLSYLLMVPNIQILAPKCLEDLPKILEYAININEPVAIRYPRGGDKLKIKSINKITTGKWEMVSNGEKLVILATGKMVQYAILAKNKLENKYNPLIVNAVFIKPLDNTFLDKIIKEGYSVLTIEDNVKIGGFGEYVNSILIQKGFKKKIKIMGYEDHFIDHASVDELLDLENLGVDAIINEIKKLY
ncbi:MAG: 1-deoxy-D-xylulose-5-phosphate synthase [Bacilli bacterium]|jgi:1-deoxy-D-xylulose-5-phosphate synthase|nr:1-deoxy-D-xylulose-5-phosphate synthase [Bacilli bacterium]